MKIVDLHYQQVPKKLFMTNERVKNSWRLQILSIRKTLNYILTKIKHMGVFFHEFRKTLQFMFVWDACRNVQKFMVIRQCSSSKVFFNFLFPATSESTASGKSSFP